MGRPLRKDRLEAMEKILPQVLIAEEKMTAEGNLDPRSLFPTAFKETWFEIGFGNGEHLAALKEKYTDVAFLGAEPFVNGMANLMKEIAEEPLDNIRVFMDDAMLLSRSLTSQSLDRIYILNPDPWPKVRHHKRRIISQTNLDEFARLLKQGGRLVMATDVDDLAGWMVTECMIHRQFRWLAKSAKDWQTPPREWTETRYAFKGKQAGRRQTFLLFERT
jgi:tRNA (guanine-N7-)-methyltransferase